MCNSFTAKVSVSNFKVERWENLDRPNALYVFYVFYRAMHFSAKRGIAIACRLSVCLSVCL